MGQSVATISCPECAAFLEAVIGIRGPQFLERKRKGLRHSYTPGPRPYRDGSVSVSKSFHGDLVGDCRRWVEHVEEVGSDPLVHLKLLPPWLRAAVKGVDFSAKLGVDAGARVAAQLLGMAPRSIYRHGRFRG